MKGITFVRLAGMFLLAGLLSGVGAMAQTTGQQPATPPAQADKDKAPAPVAGLTLAW